MFTHLPPPPISENVLKKLLLICTTEVPFWDIGGKMYVQSDGVTMGSPLGPTFAIFFMSEIETRALANITIKPNIYGRYIDDIFLLCDENTLNTLKDEMIIISGLNFTDETAVNNKLPFLNVLVEKEGERFKTVVYRKPTDIGVCMNAVGDSPQQYKSSVIKGFLYRAKTLCSDTNDMMLEIKRAKQILINNGYSNSEVDMEIRKFLKSFRSETISQNENSKTHTLFYRNFMNSSYQKDEHILKEIIKDNVTTKNSEDKLKLVIYYKTMKTSNMVMRNNLGSKVRELSKTDVIYDYRCKKGDCENLPIREVTYSGLTTCTLSRRLTYHLQDGAIQRHNIGKHHVKVTRKEIEAFTRIRYQERDFNRLNILESLIINFEEPEINKQDTGKMRTLKLYGSSRHVSRTINVND